MTSIAQRRSSYPLWAAGNGWAGQNVVATDFYLDNLLELLGDDFDPAGSETTRTVELTPEPDNEHDPNAVSVRFRDRTIGYLPREDAARYQPPLLELIGLGYLPTVDARISASESNDWDELGNPRRTVHAQIRLRLTGPETMVPSNDPPAAPYTLVPPGSSVQVLRTADHFDVLRCYPATNGAAALLVSLHPVDHGSGRSGRRLVEVRLDGRRIGQLSPAMSEKYLPAIDHLAGRGLTACARAVATASPVSAKVALRARKAFELSDAELNGPPTTIPARGVPVPDDALLRADAPAADTAPPAEVSVQSGVTAAGSTITVWERHSRSIVSVLFEFREPPTAWQRKVATKVVAKAGALLAGTGTEAPAAEFSDAKLEAHAPLDCAQEFVDALIGIEDSEFSAAEEFCER